MKILGFRADPQAPRYAIVDATNDVFSLLNANSESKLTFPAQCANDAEKLKWLHHEIERIFNEHADIARVVIKSNEFVGTENKAKRFSAYEDSVVILASSQRNIEVCVKTYSSLPANSKTVKEQAALRVAQTAMYWDNKMADAVIAAWWGGNNP